MDFAYSSCFALCLIIRNSKKNKTNKPEVYSCLRNKNAKICPHSALALHFVNIFMIARRKFPQLEQYTKWSKVKLVKPENSPDDEKEISYSAHASAMETMFKALRIVTSKLTHIGRRSGAQMAQMLGASLSAIKQAGGWEEGSLERSYLVGVSNEVNQALAGFGDKEYYLPRAQVEVPEQLQRLVIPQVNKYLDMTDDEYAGLPFSSQSFVEVVKYLRTVFIQDSVALKKIYPEHPMWKLPLFQTRLYIEYAKLWESRVKESGPVEMMLQNALPEMYNFIKDQEERIHGRVDGRISDIEALLRTQTKRLGLLITYLGRAFLPFVDYKEESVAVVDDMLNTGWREAAEETFDFYREACNVRSGDSDGTSPQARVQRINAGTEARRGKKRKSPEPSSSQRRIDFAMDYGAESIEELWDEYKNGSNGNRSIEELESENIKYWSNDAEAMVRKHRLKIIDLIKYLSTEMSKPEYEVVKLLHKWYKRQKRKHLT